MSVEAIIKEEAYLALSEEEKKYVRVEVSKPDPLPGKPQVEYCYYYHRIYRGRVVALREANYHDDSDFYCTVFAEDNCGFFEFEYGTTRFAGSNWAARDASEALQCLWAAYVEGKRIMAGRVADKLTNEYCEKVGLSTTQYERLNGNVSRSKLHACLNLLGYKTRATTFKGSLQNQLRVWLERPESSFPTPFSSTQWLYVEGFMRETCVKYRELSNTLRALRYL
jgi:hypothetical protein